MVAKKVKLALSFNAEMARELEDISVELEEPKSRLMERAWALYYAYLDSKIAEKRLAAVKSGKTRTIQIREAFKDIC